MNERDYNRLRSEIEADYKKKMEALELVWKMARKGASAARVSNGRGALLTAVREAVSEIHGTFTVRDVEKRIKEKHAELGPLKRPSLSSTLKRLEEDRELEVVVRGQGKRPTSYRRVAVKVG